MSNHRTYTVGRAARVFAVLGNPHRLRVAARLARCCRPGASCCAPADVSRCVGDLSRGLGIAPATLSHHIKELQSAGVIRCSRRGRHVDCCIDVQTVRTLAAFLSGLVPAPTAAEGARR